jgi:hypothetical protein
VLCFSHIVISAESSGCFEEFRSALAPAIQECLKNNVTNIDFISADQKHSFPCGEDVVQIAMDAWGLSYADLVGLTFFVGPKGVLTRRYRNVVPLIDQGLQGIEHIIGYARKIVCERVLTYTDLATFPERALSCYKRKEMPVTMRDMALAAATDLSATFSNIQAIFGGGFPFYLVENDDLNQLGPTPDSIFKYFLEQHQYFRKKIVPAMQFSEAVDKELNVDVLDQLGMFFGRNKFDEFSKTLRYGIEAPIYVMDGYTVGSYYADTGFDLSEDIWPCQYCTHFHDPAVYQTLTVKRNFNEDCMSCKQTALTLRNVMSCVADIDLVIVVNDDADIAAHRIESFIRQHPQHFVFDTRPRDTILEYTTPLDAFIVTEASIEDAFNRLSSGCREEDVKLSALALWLPIKPHRLDLGTNFVLSCELLSSLDTKWRNKLWTTRRKYASIKEPNEVVSRLQQGSLYHQQLLGVPWISNNIVKKLNRWKDRAKNE